MFMWKNLTRTRKKRDRDAKSSEETKEGVAEDDDAGGNDAEERGKTEETKGRRPYEDETDALLHEFWLERKASAVGAAAAGARAADGPPAAGAGAVRLGDSESRTTLTWSSLCILDGHPECV